jgi:hypothetical protein
MDWSDDAFMEFLKKGEPNVAEAVGIVSEEDGERGKIL